MIGFLLLIGVILFIDLKLMGNKDGTVSLTQAGIMSAFVILLSLGFAALLRFYGNEIHDIHSISHLQEVVTKYRHPIKIDPSDLEKSLKIYNRNLSLEFLTGYIVEYALSVDNIFVMVMLFSSFGVARENYHKVLVWGILGAIVMRLAFIFAGAALIEKFSWIMYVFGIFLVLTGIKMFFNRNKEENVDIKKNPVVRFAYKHLRMHDGYVGDRFFVRINGVLKITPLFLVLLVIESTDLLFAVDSIPAIFSVTKDPYIVFFSNIFAIIGLRSMFFLLAGVINKFRYLQVGLAALLVFIGAKMLLHDYLKDFGFTTAHSLFIIVGILAASIIASLVIPEKKA